MKNTKHKQIILSPIITQKSTLLASSEKNKCYTFMVAPDANKFQIQRAFEEIFGGKVSRVNTTAVRAKTKRTKAGYKRKSDGKKAYIWADATIDLSPKV